MRARAHTHTHNAHHLSFHSSDERDLSSPVSATGLGATDTKMVTKAKGEMLFPN